MRTARSGCSSAFAVSWVELRRRGHFKGLYHLSGMVAFFSRKAVSTSVPENRGDRYKCEREHSTMTLWSGYACRSRCRWPANMVGLSSPQRLPLVSRHVIFCFGPNRENVAFGNMIKHGGLLRHFRISLSSSSTPQTLGCDCSRFNTLIPPANALRTSGSSVRYN